MIATPPPPPAADMKPAPHRPEAPHRDAALRDVAVEFEAAFLAQMLSHAGLGRPPDGFAGGAGEEAFASFLTREQARLLAASGALGLADSIHASLSRAALSSEEEP